MMRASDKTIRIVGAGFSGLTLAFYLNRLGMKVEIFERAPGPGGILKTTRTPYGLVESSANALMNSPELESLCQEIGLQMFHALPSAKARYIFRGRPRRIPFLAFEFFKICQFLFKMIFMRKSLAPFYRESVRTWGQRMLSPKLSFFTLETALQGIYAGAPEKLSAHLILKNILSPVKLKKNFKRGSVAPLGGMSEFSEKLSEYLQKKGVKFYFNHSFKYKPDLNPVVLATPAFEAAKILETEQPELSQKLLQIEYLPIITANVFFKTEAPHLKGFGCLFPPEVSNIVLGVLFNQCIFEGRVKEALSEAWILGGARVHDRKDFLAMSDHQVLNTLLEKRKLLFKEQSRNILSDVLDVKITRWERAFPHYTVQLESLLQNLNSNPRNIFLHGNYLGQLGLTKILSQSAQLAEQLAKGI
jgi:oxygen-dependent protoporphyrinogen oxidase